MLCDWGQGTICDHRATHILVCGNFNGDIYKMFICEPHSDNITSFSLACYLCTNKYGEIIIDEFLVQNL